MRGRLLRRAMSAVFPSPSNCRQADSIAVVALVTWQLGCRTSCRHPVRPPALGSPRRQRPRGLAGDVCVRPARVRIPASHRRFGRRCLRTGLPRPSRGDRPRRHAAWRIGRAVSAPSARRRADGGCGLPGAERRALHRVEHAIGRRRLRSNRAHPVLASGTRLATPRRARLTPPRASASTRRQP